MEGNELAERQDGELTTAHKGQPVSIEVRTLVVGGTSRKSLRFGDTAGLASYAKRNEPAIECVVWNELGLHLVMNGGAVEVSYIPEVYPETAMFLSREHTREKVGFGGPEGKRVWQGEFEPVLFAKKDLVKFLKNHTTGGDQSVLESIKSLRVTQKREETEEMLDVETDDVHRTETETEVTNIPRHFNLTMPVTEGIDAIFEFEAALHKPDPYDYSARREAQHKRIAVRAVNARPVLRDVMKNVLERLPLNVPKYYGRFEFTDGSRGRD
jgi:hypothetical protein